MRKFLRLLPALIGIIGFSLTFQGCQKEEIPEPVAGETEILRGQYIVVMDNGAERKSTEWPSYEEGIRLATERTTELLEDNSISVSNVEFVYGFVVNGFSATLTDEELLRLREDERVMNIEPVKRVSISSTQSNATWGIDRVDQRALPLNQTYTWNGNGTGVRAYILDTGIRYSHNEFGGRASFGFDAFGGNGSDGNGHGTHVAGTVGGAIFGIAKNVLLISVRVLNDAGSGTTAGVIAGMDWVAANHIKPAVANMSLGGGASQTMDDAVTRLFQAGVPVIVAAGNSNVDACGSSPARAANAYTVGSTTSTDARSSFSNWGACVEIFAPGSSITSAWHTTNRATRTISGTSMAAPHVAGSAAIFLGRNPTSTPTQVYSFISNNSTKSIVNGANSANNHLLFTLLP